MNLRQYKTAADRREALSRELKITLDHTAKALVDQDSAIHCENLIGAVSIPVGVAGPLHLNGTAIQGSHVVPLATTEGALVASVSRGCKATESTGITTYAARAGTTRGPVFYTGSLAESRRLVSWITDHTKLIAETAEQTSRHLRFKELLPRFVADHVFVRIAYDTDDAMGMNMVTIATQEVVRMIERETGISCLAVAGNFDIDKKPAWLNLIYNRGFAVWAEATIDEPTLRTVLKTSAAALFNVWLGKCVFGSIMSGSLGFNAHFANIIAAIYAATGQDLAHITEGSMGITTMRQTESAGIYISVYLPSLLIGTIGGGTKLATQSELRSLAGVTHSPELAELAGAAVLAGELSLLSSLAEGTLATAHQKLGR